MSTAEPVDISIVGAGLAGLTAAILAARGGRRVRLFAGRSPGGRAITDRVDGYALNQGAHALYLGGEAARTWADLGIEMPGSSPNFPMFSQLDGALHRLPASVSTLLSTSLLPWPSKVRLGALFARLPALARAAGPEPFGEWLAAHTSDPDVARVFLALARLSTFIADPRPIRADGVLRQLQLAGDGVRYIDGGWQTAVARLHDAAIAGGVEVLSQRVTGVSPDGAAWRTEVHDGEATVSNAVIVATGPTAFARLTGVAVPELTPVRAAALDLGLRRLPDPAHPFVLDLDRPRYGSAQSLAAAIAPADAAVLHLLVYLGPDETAERGDVEAWLDGWQPGWRDEVHVARWRPGLVVQNRAARSDAPVVTVDAAPGLLRAGDWVGEGFLSDAAVASAVEAVAHAERHLALRRAG
jgi:phytoene dehydrogenase-like protein